jgi:hypothetical protein
MHKNETFAQGLCDILVKNKTIDQKESEAMHKAFANSEYDEFDDFLIEEGLVEESDLLRALSLYYKVPSFDVNGYFFSNMLLHQFPKDLLLRNGVIPLELENDDMLVVVASQPEKPGLESQMREFISYDIEYMVGIKRDICDAIKEYYDKPPTDDSDFDDMNMDEEDRLEKEALLRDELLEDLPDNDKE